MLASSSVGAVEAAGDDEFVTEMIPAPIVELEQVRDERRVDAADGDLTWFAFYSIALSSLSIRRHDSRVILRFPDDNQLPELPLPKSFEGQYGFENTGKARRSDQRLPADRPWLYRHTTALPKRDSEVFHAGRRVNTVMYRYS